MSLILCATITLASCPFLYISHDLQEDEEVLKRRKEEEEDQDVDVTGFDDESSMGLVAVDALNEKSADLQWVEDDPDNDTYQYFPPVYPEPLEVSGY